ncbi:hypothetical protein AV521_17655 [Streptomyces sp. IMTB 2501]|nr:hypothetical protein AV521_17655 [Streptomyces sp. IMTB 2501]
MSGTQDPIGTADQWRRPPYCCWVQGSSWVTMTNVRPCPRRRPSGRGHDVVEVAREALYGRLVAVGDGEVDAAQRHHRLLARRTALGDAGETGGSTPAVGGVRRPARAAELNAAASTAPDSRLPTLVTRSEAVGREPEFWQAEAALKSAPPPRSCPR